MALDPTLNPEYISIMPLIKSPSKKALQENIKTEMKKKPAKQAEAIGYAVQREAKKARKK